MNRALVLRLSLEGLVFEPRGAVMIAVAGSLSIGSLYLRGRDHRVPGVQRGADLHHLPQHPAAACRPSSMSARDRTWPL